MTRTTEADEARTAEADEARTKFCVWLRASGHTHRGLSCHELLLLWKAQR